MSKRQDYAIGRGVGPMDGLYIVLTVDQPGLSGQDHALKTVAEMCGGDATLVAANDRDEALVTYGYAKAIADQEAGR
jgi:hypothetical protein